MKLLAFDTSNQALSLAILENDTILATVTLNNKKNHSVTLMPSIEFLMATLELQPKDLDRIVVAMGPGSYTGLRIAVTTAKTLAQTLKIDLIGISSLLALVPAGIEGLVIPLIDARRNNVYAGFYKNTQAVRSEEHLPFETVLELASSEKQVTFVGEVAAFEEQIRKTLPNACIYPTLPNAVEIGRMGLSLPAQSIHDFVPNYLKRVEAEENWLKNHKESHESYLKRL
ncbi:MAG: tRNA (adenosine(37)-N6)-threonylcarbamoyltransferase complex dimerization subunit type 1 TsaB [Streptococcus sp.]|nr:tRNA (adenosine(37)-N6)-threonylcarbamoyltransferase complex dimerization subunit type 1 TsaB [Streptococcus sp.]